MQDHWTIKVDYWAKPIPDRSQDYIAFFEGQEEDVRHYGFGATLAAALRDMAASLEHYEEEGCRPTSLNIAARKI